MHTASVTRATPGTTSALTATLPSTACTRLFNGDSITDCGRREEPDGLGDGFVDLPAEEDGAREGGATVLNRGTSGHKAADLGARFGPDCLDLARSS